MQHYHDTEWGVPLSNDRRLFEFLVLEGMQAGLSWRTVLHKREAFRKAFDGFDPERVARYGRAKINRLLQNAGIIRNRQKIEAAVANAKAFLRLQDRHGTFARFMWSLIDGRPIQHAWRSIRQLPATTRESDRMSQALKEQGFRFVGSTICYAHMQATGMVNDHLVHCFRYPPIRRLGQRLKKVLVSSPQVLYNTPNHTTLCQAHSAHSEDVGSERRQSPWRCGSVLCQGPDRPRRRPPARTRRSSA
jgi:DNA-3-methyladenine glycosylase I